MRTFALVLICLRCTPWARRAQKTVKQTRGNSYRLYELLWKSDDAEIACRGGSSAVLRLAGLDYLQSNRRTGVSRTLKGFASLLLAFNHAAGWQVSGAIDSSILAGKNFNRNCAQLTVQMKGSAKKKKKSSSAGFGSGGFGGKPKPVTTKSQGELLHIVPYEDPVLQEKAEDVDFPLSDENAKLIGDMLFSVKPKSLREAGADFDDAAGMAAPQWGKSRRIFVIQKEFLTGDWAKGAEDLASGGVFVACINPIYKPLPEEGTDKFEKVDAWEGCFSVPGKRGKVWRWRRIEAKFQSRDNKNYTVLLEDWAARVFQHETEHCFGRLYDDKSAGQCLKLVDMASKQERLDALEADVKAGKVKNEKEYDRLHEEIMMSD